MAINNENEGLVKHLIIVRVVSNSGKSSFVRSIMTDEDEEFSGGQFMVDENGKYRYSPSKISGAHQKCQDAVEDAMEMSVSHIFVHNTFCAKKDMDPYVELAERYGYKIHYIIVESRGRKGDLSGVPAEIREKQKKNFDISL
ncbi:hypothetical protein HY249_03365 [Candidatus Azambacteria bacterium]|nr:hypothetical protein [Candidatus Azambacteria bacterium]